MVPCCSVSVMRFCYGISICLAAVGLVVAGVACGSGKTGTSSADQSCVVEMHGAPARIRLHNSGLTCARVKTILFLLPNAVGISPIKASIPSEDRVCRIYPRSALPLEVRCYQGTRYFEVVAVPRSAKHH